ncbi:MAG: TIGR04211 family SH3 domain-containing protein [Steroidobacteraceae bacterium]
MKRSAALALALAAASLVSAVSRVSAAVAYVSDQLVLNVYAEQNQQGQRLATLHSGARVETLATAADYTQVRLPDGVTGWVKSSYLTTDEPAAVRVKQLEEELDRSRATTPALAEAAAKSETERLERELADKRAQLDAALAVRAPAAGVAPQARPRTLGAGLGLGIGVVAAALGFWAGYVTLARRVRRKFGGLKVY